MNKRGSGRLLLIFFFVVFLLFFALALVLSLSHLLSLSQAVKVANYRAPVSYAPEQTSAFAETTAEAGVTTSRRGDDKITGQAWGDFDNDGWLDLYVTDTAGGNILYHNDQAGTFSISPLAAAVALSETFSAGANFVDYDNDGWSDLYVLNWGANTLFRNEAGTGFRDVTAQAGLDDTSNGKTAAWGDYDQDGLLDLYIANWACSPRCGRPRSGDKDRLYHNEGDGTFTDVTSALGSKTRGAGFVASFVDYDNDGDLDIYLVNDEFINPIGNILWRNDGSGCDPWCFTDVSKESGTGERVMGMGLATADYDGDGDLDFYFSNAGPMVLLQNQGDGTFVNGASGAGVDLGSRAIGWGAVFFDYDNDGWRDLYVALADRVDDLPPANPLFHNNGNGTFSDRGLESGAADPGRTIGVAYADYDNDGWVDLVIGNYDQGYVLYHNQGSAKSPRRRVSIRLEGAGTVNRDAVGSRVNLTTSDGRTQMQAVQNGSSLGSGNALNLYFGLDQADIDRLQVVWPNGASQQFENVDPDQSYTLTYSPNLWDNLQQQLVLDANLRRGVWVLLGLAIMAILVVGLMWIGY